MSIIVVTVTYNDYANLKRTIESVRANKKHYHRYMIIDGASTDETQSLIKTNLDIIDDWISERDHGIYDAMNKASRFNIAEDDLIIWLNAGDLLTNWEGFAVDQFYKYDCVFSAVYAKFSDEYEQQLISPRIKLPYDERNFFPSSTFMHQGFLIKKRIFDKMPYDIDIGIQAENLLMSQCIQKCKYGRFDFPLSIFYLDGISNRDFSKLFFSYLSVANKLGFAPIKVYIYQFAFLAKTGLKIFLPHKLFNLIRKK